MSVVYYAVLWTLVCVSFWTFDGHLPSWPTCLLLALITSLAGAALGQFL